MSAEPPPSPKKRGLGPILLLGGVLILCGAVGVEVYWLVGDRKDAANDTVENKVNPRVNEANYKSIHINMTRAQVEDILGPGRPIADTEMTNSLGVDGQPTAREWAAKAQQGKVIAWRNGDNFILICFYPHTEPDGKVQASAWEPKVGFGSARDGSVDDRLYLEAYSKLEPGRPIEVTAEEVVKQYRDNSAVADVRYKDKHITVEGKLRNVAKTAVFTEANLEGLPPPPDKPQGFRVWCHLTPDAARVLSKVAPGTTIKLKGKCVGVNDTVVNLFDCVVVSAGGKK